MEVRSKYGNKSLRVLGVHIWNPLTDNIEYETSMNIFKGYIKTWFAQNVNVIFLQIKLQSFSFLYTKCYIGHFIDFRD